MERKTSPIPNPDPEIRKSSEGQARQEKTPITGVRARVAALALALGSIGLAIGFLNANNEVLATEPTPTVTFHTATPVPSDTPTLTSTPTQEVTRTPTATVTREATPTVTLHTATPVPSETPTRTPTATATREVTPTTVPHTPTVEASPTPSNTPTVTPTRTRTPEATATERPGKGQLKLEKYNDRDRDGRVPEPGEEGLIWEFSVDGPGANDSTTVTLDDGTVIESVAPGRYRICERRKPGWEATIADCVERIVREGQMAEPAIFGNVQVRKEETATATPVSPTHVPPKEKVQLVVKKRLDANDNGIFDKEDQPLTQKFGAWIDTNRNREFDPNEQPSLRLGQTDKNGVDAVTFEGSGLGAGTLLCAQEFNLAEELEPIVGKSCDDVDDDSGVAEVRLLNANREEVSVSTPVPTPVPMPEVKAPPKAGSGGFLEVTKTKNALIAYAVAGLSILGGLAYKFGKRGLEQESLVKVPFRRRKR